VLETRQQLDVILQQRTRAVSVNKPKYEHRLKEVGEYVTLESCIDVIDKLRIYSP